MLGAEIGLGYFYLFTGIGFLILSIGISVGIVGYLERRSRRYLKDFMGEADESE